MKLNGSLITRIASFVLSTTRTAALSDDVEEPSEGDESVVEAAADSSPNFISSHLSGMGGMSRIVMARTDIAPDDMLKGIAFEKDGCATLVRLKCGAVSWTRISVEIQYHLSAFYVESLTRRSTRILDRSALLGPEHRTNHPFSFCTYQITPFRHATIQMYETSSNGPDLD